MGGDDVRVEKVDDSPVCLHHEALAERVSGLHNLLWKTIAGIGIGAGLILGIIQWNHADNIHNIEEVQGVVDKNRQELEQGLSVLGTELKLVRESQIRTEEAITEAKRRGKL